MNTENLKNDIKELLYGSVSAPEKKLVQGVDNLLKKTESSKQWSKAINLATFTLLNRNKLRQAHEDSKFLNSLKDYLENSGQLGRNKAWKNALRAAILTSGVGIYFGNKLIKQKAIENALRQSELKTKKINTALLGAAGLLGGGALVKNYYDNKSSNNV